MDRHFHSFTPEAMRDLGEQLAAGLRQRFDFIDRTKSQTLALLDTARRQQREAESQRLQQAERALDARTLFIKDLKSGVHSLLGRFELRRQEMAGELHDMAGELHAARDAWSKRPHAHR